MTSNCPDFRSHNAALIRCSPERVHVLGPFNSGTHFGNVFLVRNGFTLLEHSIEKDLFKHYPGPLLRIIGDRQEHDITRVLFVVMVRDPFEWLLAMAKTPYELRFSGLDDPCRIGLEAMNFEESYNAHLSRLRVPRFEKYFEFNDIREVWSRTYTEYVELASVASYNLYFLRYEDLLLRPAEMLEELALLFKTEPSDAIIPLRPAKNHGDPSGYVAARKKFLREGRGAALNATREEFLAGIPETLLRWFGYETRA